MTVVPNVRATSASSVPSASELAASSRDVGSSAMITSGFAASARASAARSRWPAESSDTGRSACSSRPTAAIASAAAPVGSAAQLERDLRVLAGAEERDEADRLADERDRAPPQLGAAGTVEARQRHAVDEHVPLVGKVEPGEEVQQRRLAGARRPGDGRDRPGSKRRVEPLRSARRRRTAASPRAPRWLVFL